jgi:hypothetical protein
VAKMVEELLARGNGAQLQRSTRSGVGSMAGVVADAVRRTRES